VNGVDYSFANILEQRLLWELRGEDGNGGLYQGLMASPDWDGVNRTRGMIQGYENVLRLIQEVRRKMNDEAEQPVYRRPN